jgi:hypothetical protein
MLYRICGLSVGSAHTELERGKEIRQSAPNAIEPRRPALSLRMIRTAGEKARRIARNLFVR